MEEYIETEEIKGGMVAYQQDKAIMATQVDIAKRYPRNVARCIQNLTTFVTLDIETAEACTYSLVKGNKAVIGPSVNLAKMIVQEFGNMRIENKVLDVTDRFVISEATCFDMEKNIAMRTTVRKSIIGKSGRYSEDMIVITGNALNAIALRNAIFAVVPRAVTDKLHKMVLKKISGEITTQEAFDAKKISLFNSFRTKYADYNLTELEVCKIVGKNTISDVTRDDVIVLIGIEKSLQAGEADFEATFRPKLKNQAPSIPADKSEERLLMLIDKAKTKAELKKLEKECKTNEERIAYDEKFKALQS